MKYVEMSIKQWNMLRLLFIQSKDFSTLVTQSDVHFVKLSYVFYFDFCGFRQLKIRHFVSVHSTNLFRYRTVTSGPVCRSVYSCPHSYTRYTAKLTTVLLRHNARARYAGSGKGSFSLWYLS
jgi:hypothetical protein